MLFSQKEENCQERAKFADQSSTDDDKLFWVTVCNSLFFCVECSKLRTYTSLAKCLVKRESKHRFAYFTFVCLCRSPQYGEIRVRDQSVKEFAQADIWNRAVRYLHTSGEIGIDPVYDSATFAVTDGSFPGIQKERVLVLLLISDFLAPLFLC